MLIDGIITLMNANTGLAGLVSGRIYKNVLPRGYLLPAIAVHRYGGSQDYDFAGPVDISEDQLQIDVYGTDANSCQEVAASVRALLAPFTGALSDGTVVQACYLERDMDMPFLPHADSKGLANRAVLGFRIVNTAA